MDRCVATFVSVSFGFIAQLEDDLRIIVIADIIIYS